MTISWKEGIDKMTLEHLINKRAYENAKVLELNEWLERFEESKWLIEKIAEEFFKN